MRRRLLHALAEVRASLPLKLALGFLVVCLYPLALVVDILAERKRDALIADTLKQHVARCPRGHIVELVGGGWTCPVCSLVYSGHGYFCPHCEDFTAAAVRCACGLSVRSPVWEAQ